MSGAESQVSADSTRFQGAPEASGPSRERLDRPAAPLTFARLSRVNRARARRWHDGFPHREGPHEWTGADWSNAMCGEAGETANVVKKLRRQETNLRGAVDPDFRVLIEKLGDEIADTLIYADLLATYYGVDLAAAIVRKFNAISEREGLPERLP